jgi:hypothetical protein
MANPITRKIGPLPAWGWFAILVGAVLYYRHLKNSQSGAGTPPVPFGDPNAGLDGPPPTTGGSTDGSTSSTPDITGEINDVSNLMGALQALQAQLLGQPLPGTPTTGADVGSGAANTPGKHRKRRHAHPPAKKVRTHHRGGGSGRAKVVSTHRAPAHSNENTAHQHHSHLRPPPAHTRIHVSHHGGGHHGGGHHDSGHHDHHRRHR